MPPNKENIGESPFAEEATAPVPVDRVAFLEHVDGLLGNYRDPLYNLTVQKGNRVLDVGHGTGLSQSRIIERIGPEGHLVGVELIPDLIATARERRGREGEGVFLAVGDGKRLPFAGPFEVALIERVFHHLPPDSVDAVLRDVFRILKEGGRVGVADPGWMDWSITHPDKDMSNLITQFKRERNIHNPRIALTIEGQLIAAGFQIVTQKTVPVVITDASAFKAAFYSEAMLAKMEEAGVMDPGKNDFWHKEMHSAANQGMFRSDYSTIITVATK